MKKDYNTVLVSGASSGLGLAVANYLAKKGFNVYAGARSFKTEGTEKLEGTNGSLDKTYPDPIGQPGVEAAVSKIMENDVAADAQPPKAESMEKPEGISGCLHKIYLDVTDQSSIDAAVNKIMENEGKIDVLINCAVHLVLGSVEDTSIDEFRGVMEAGFFGDLRTCKSVLPAMRSQKKGLIINFSSINGVMAVPFEGPYGSMKFAIEGLTETLSLEVKDFGIDVVMIEPSDHRSGSKAYRSHAKLADSADSPYYKRYMHVTEKIHHDETTGSHPEGLANLIYKIILKKKPKLRYTVGKFDQRLSVVLKRILPGRTFEKIIYSYYYGSKSKQ